MHILKKILAVIPFFFVFDSNSFAQTGKEGNVRSSKLYTVWAKNKRTESDIDKYPRPQMERNDWTNLNGKWQYKITDTIVGLPQTFDSDIVVPYPIESPLSGVERKITAGQFLWYRKLLKLPKATSQERVLLNFGAVDWKTSVFVNRKFVGEHTGGYTSFSFDITDYLNEQDNEIIVKVYDPTEKGIGPHGKQTSSPGNIYYTSISGIWQTVWLEKVPIDRIVDLKIKTDIERNMVALNIITTNKNSDYLIEVTIFDEKKIVATKAQTNNAFNMEIPKAKLWSPDSPFLYNLTIVIKKRNGKIVDKIRSYFGMRKIDIQKDSKGLDRIFLNNKFTYNLGVLDQGYWPDGLYTAPSDSALAFDIEVIKRMGFNTIRKHIKVEPARWYYYADKIGVMVWQDMVSPNQGLPEGSKVQFEKECKEIVSQLYNNPSVTTYVLFNEKWGRYDQERLTRWIKEMDSTRLINGHSGEFLYVNDQLSSPSPNAYVASDITDVHSYPNPRISLKQEGKAQVCGEFGGVTVSIFGHQWDDVAAWGYDETSVSEFEKKYASMILQLKKMQDDGLSGSIYTQPFDVETEENGLITYDREIIKIPFQKIRSLNEQLVGEKNLKPPLNLTFGPTPKDADATDNYESIVEKYKQGINDSALIRRLIVMTSKKQAQDILESILYKYLSDIKDVYSPDNLSLIRYTVHSENDFGFQFFCKHSERIDSVMGIDYTSKVVRGIIDAKLAPIILKMDTIVDFALLRREAVDKYGKEGERSFLTHMALHYYFAKNYDEFINTKVEIHRKFPNTISTFDMNNDAWEVFLNVSDTNKLKIALVWSEEVVKKESTANYYDTYANLLYKIGRKEEAIRAQEFGLSQEPGNGSVPDIKAHLDMMKKGEKTW